MASGFKSQFAGNFNWDIVGASPNIPEENYSARFHSVTFSNEGNDRCYFDQRKLNIDFKYTLKTNPITYDANGGTGAPAAQTKYYNVDTTLSFKANIGSSPNGTYACSAWLNAVRIK